jgi:hypothetical protein
MPQKGGKAAEPYKFPASFERNAVVLACTRPRFMGRVGGLLEPDLLEAEPAKLALQAAQAIYRDTGKGPTKQSLVLQRLQRLSDDGKVTAEQIQAVNDYFDQSATDGLPSESHVEAEIVPILKRRAALEVGKEALNAYGKDDGFDKLKSLVSHAESIGTQSSDTGTTLKGAAAEVAALRGMKRLPTGITELDSFLDGGLPEETVGLIIAGPGGAKSMGLSHFTAHALREHQNVAVATLELSRAEVICRIAANLTGIPTKELRGGRIEEALYMMGGMNLGRFHIKDFTAQATTMDDISSWVDQCEEEDGEPINFLDLDYVDLLKGSNGKVGKGTGSYQEQGTVMWDLHTWTKERKKRSWTASQSRAREEKKAKKIDMEHTADSMHKPRVADIVLTFNYNEETNEMSFWVAKHRFGDARRMIGPLPAYFATGQVAPVERAPWDQQRAAAADARARIGGARLIRVPGEEG